MKKRKTKDKTSSKTKNLRTKKPSEKDRANQNPAQDLINFILEFRILKYTPRACLPYFKNSIKENIAEHSFYTAIIGWVLAVMAKADADKVIKMCLIHDLAEVRGGEKNLIHKFYTTPNNETSILKEICNDYNLEQFSFGKIFQDFVEVKTLEAKIAKDADILAQMLLEKESLDLGNFRAKRWLSTSLKRLETKQAKELGEALYEIDTDKWWLAIIKKYVLKTKFLSPDEPFFHCP